MLSHSSRCLLCGLWNKEWRVPFICISFNTLWPTVILWVRMEGYQYFWPRLCINPCQLPSRPQCLLPPCVTSLTPELPYLQARRTPSKGWSSRNKARPLCGLVLLSLSRKEEAPYPRMFWGFHLLLPPAKMPEVPVTLGQRPAVPTLPIKLAVSLYPEKKLLALKEGNPTHLHQGLDQILPVQLEKIPQNGDRGGPRGQGTFHSPLPPIQPEGDPEKQQQR